MKNPKFILKKDWYLETNVLGVKFSNFRTFINVN